MFELLIDSFVDELFSSIIKNCESKTKASPIRPRNCVHCQDFASTADFVVLPLLREQQAIDVTISIRCFSLASHGSAATPSDYASCLIFGISVLDLVHSRCWSLLFLLTFNNNVLSNLIFIALIEVSITLMY